MSTRPTKAEEAKLAQRIGNCLRAARKRQGLTQKEAARIIGVATEVFGRFERGDMLPSSPMLLGFCRGLKVSPDDLFGLLPVEALKPTQEQAPLVENLPRGRHALRLLRALPHLSPTQLRLVTMLVDDLVDR
jgi:transcriptional regulator with XRE-family HTH domain